MSTKQDYHWRSNHRIVRSPIVHPIPVKNCHRHQRKSIRNRHSPPSINHRRLSFLRRRQNCRHQQPHEIKKQQRKRRNRFQKLKLLNQWSMKKTKTMKSDSEGQYDLTTSIEESGGIDRFLNTPCMILYRRNLTNQG